ncbi:MAG: MBL fold metallo-hydrolase [Thermomicrobiales bacterium]
MTAPSPTSLTILGGSAAGVGTGYGCSGSLVQHDGTSVVLDLGPDTLLELRKQTDIRALDGIVVSHLHLDHILDLFAMRFTLAYAPVPLERKIPLWVPPGGIAFFERAGEPFMVGHEHEPFMELAFEMHEYDPQEALQIGALTITFQRSEHPMACWSMRVAIPGGRDFVYTADTADIERLFSFGKDAHVLLSEATRKETPEPGVVETSHISPAMAGTLATEIGAQVLILTHMFEEDDPHRAIARAQETFGGDVLQALPGVTVQW